VIFFQVGRHEKCLRGVPSAKRGGDRSERDRREKQPAGERRMERSK